MRPQTKKYVKVDPTMAALAARASSSASAGDGPPIRIILKL